MGTVLLREYYSAFFPLPEDHKRNKLSALMESVPAGKEVGEVCYYVFGFPWLLFQCVCVWHLTSESCAVQANPLFFFVTCVVYWLLVFKEQISQCDSSGFYSVCSLWSSTLLNCLIPAPCFMGRHFSNFHKPSDFHFQKEISKLITFEQGKTLADAEGDVFRGLRKLLAAPVKKGALRTCRKGSRSSEQLIALGFCKVAPFIASYWKKRGNCNSNLKSSLRVS